MPPLDRMVRNFSVQNGTVSALISLPGKMGLVDQMAGAVAVPIDGDQVIRVYCALDRSSAKAAEHRFRRAGPPRLCARPRGHRAGRLQSCGLRRARHAVGRSTCEGFRPSLPARTSANAGFRRCLHRFMTASTGQSIGPCPLRFLSEQASSSAKPRASGRNLPTACPAIAVRGRRPERLFDGGPRSRPRRLPGGERRGAAGQCREAREPSWR